MGNFEVVSEILITEEGVYLFILKENTTDKVLLLPLLILYKAGV
jgi:hypothetical protein